MNFCIHCILYNIFGTQDVLWVMCSTNGESKDGNLTSRDLADESCASILASLRCLSHVSALLKGSCLDGLEPMFPLRLHHNPHARYKSPTHAGCITYLSGPLGSQWESTVGPYPSCIMPLTFDISQDIVAPL
jgi:hypothetical protein